MVLSDSIFAVGSVIGVCLLALLFWRLIRWARRGGVGVMLAAASLFGFIADPVSEKQIRVVQEAREQQSEEDESGAPKD